jgi:hypothetical protein
MKTPPKKRAARIASRSVNTMAKAKSTWSRAEAIRTADNKSSKNMTVGEFDNSVEKANQLYRKAQRQEDRAKGQMKKSKSLKAKGVTPFSGIKTAGGKSNLKKKK